MYSRNEEDVVEVRKRTHVEALHRGTLALSNHALFQNAEKDSRRRNAPQHSGALKTRLVPKCGKGLTQKECTAGLGCPQDMPPSEARKGTYAEGMHRGTLVLSKHAWLNAV